MKPEKTSDQGKRLPRLKDELCPLNMGSFSSKKIKAKSADSPLGLFAKNLKARPDEECMKELNELLAKQPEECKNDTTRKRVESEETIAGYVYKTEKEHAGSDRVEGEDEEELWGHNLLHIAVCFQKNKTAILLSKEFPILITTGNESEKNYLGLTPFHIAIAQGNVEVVKNMLQYMLEEHLGIFRGHYKKVMPDSNTEDDIKALAFGERARGTVFMGQLPLTVAVLSYINHTQHNEDDDSSTDKHLDITKEFLDEKRLKLNLSERSYRGDTVFHSIMRFVNCFPNKQGKAKLVIQFLDSWMLTRLTLNERRSRFFAQNNEHQTALQLATKCSHTELFQYLIQLKDVYYVFQPHDHIYEIRRYDVTEIDKIAIQEARRQPRSVCCSSLCGNVKKNYSHGQSVAELLCSRRSLDDATSMISMDVFEAVIRRKWPRYLLCYVIFFLFHLFNVVCLNVHIVANGHEIVGRYFGPVDLVMGFNSWFLLAGLVYILQEIWRFFMAGQPMAVRAVHHNAIYRFCLLITGGCLVVHSCVNFAPDIQNNWFLTFAVIASNWFLMFFLRGCPYFSIYIVLINEALFKAVLPFAVLILLQVFVFSSCMHSFFFDLDSEALANSTTQEVTFDTYGKTLLALGKLMVGITDIEDLLSSTQDVLVLIVFVIFIVVTFLLMINALIGVMTNKFTDTQTNKVQVTYIQMLSIIIFFEGWFVGPLHRLAKRAGEEYLHRNVARTSDTGADQDTEKREVDKPDSRLDKTNPEAPNYERDKHRTEAELESKNEPKRYVISFRKVPSNQADEPSNIEHKLNRSHNILKEIHTGIDRLLENSLQRSSDQRRLHVYHYGKD